MDRLTAMRVFITVVDTGSQSAAAERLDLSRPVVSRYLAELEDWLGARLMHRTTRKLTLTPAGMELLPRCRQLLELSGELQSAATAPDAAPRGLLRVTASSSFGHAVLAPLLADYIAAQPAVRVDLQLLDRAVNLVDEGLDLAIRIASELDPNLIARRLADCPSVLCAAPAWLASHAPPLAPGGLSGLPCLTHSYYGQSLWHFTRRQDGASSRVAVGGPLSANDATALLQACRAGAGIALLPRYLAYPLLARGELTALLPDYEPLQLGIFGVYTSRKHLPASLRSLLDFLAVRLPEQAGLRA
ncbi:LysR family transcriptional regulator [Chitinilyticum piscinae]|uniref:LysR family transcriptional regulator n=1 Tax=Chitinilyticum piscinae TaxID=2866724 RepID=A0A8J7KCD1_9NEIS|nr:LysR family transcriptional regulator [Chitinilyticum piscinae]MBE9607809.1 LysR family transcriptional regulator [Chitinilyticum piscinae]